MDKKLTVHFALLTLGILLVTWIPLVILGRFGITEADYAWLFILNFIGSLSPAIASYFALKKNNRIKGFKEWVKTVLNVRIHIGCYLAVIGLFAIYHTLNRVFSGGITDTPPLYVVPIIFLMCFLNGGLEETGWRCILQPQLEKKWGFIVSAFITGLVWFVWHLPLYFMPGSESRMNIWMFLFVCIMLSFLFGAFRRISGSVFLAITAHTISNSAVGIFGDGVFLSTWAGVIGSAIVLSLVSVAAVSISDKKQAKRTE